MTTEQFITELSEVQGVDFRGDGLAPGAVVYEQTLDNTPGASATWKKAPSKVRMGGVPLPDRVSLYNRQTHDISMVPPTIAQKRMSEHPGVYTMRKPDNWDEIAPKPIDESCVVCTKERKKYGAPPKRFYDEMDLEAHYQNFHPREWGRIERERDRMERQAEQGQTNKLIAAIAAIFQQGRGGEVPQEIREAVETTAICDECGFAAKNAFGLQAHKRNKHGGS